MCARTLCPLLSSTLKVALRRHSRTVPSISMPLAVLAILDSPVNSVEVREKADPLPQERSKRFGAHQLLAAHQLQVAADPAGADALEQCPGREVGFVHLGSRGVDPAAVQCTQYVSQQCPSNAAAMLIGAHCDQ